MVANNASMVQSTAVRSEASTWDRLGAAAGIAFAVLFVAVVFAMGSGLPGGDDTNQDIARYYTEQDRLLNGLLSLYGLTLAGASFLWFLGSLRNRLRRAEEEPAGLASIVFGSGLIFVGALFGAAAAAGAIASSVELGEETQVQPVVASLGWLASLLLLVPGMFAASIAIVATSVLALRTGVFPRWLAWMGFACAALLILLGWAFMPMFVLPLWVLATSVALLRQR